VTGKYPPVNKINHRIEYYVILHRILCQQEIEEFILMIFLFGLNKTYTITNKRGCTTI